nr:MAG TPA: hypothetical protein [Caudoviricetes sp.]
MPAINVSLPIQTTQVALKALLWLTLYHLPI